MRKILLLCAMTAAVSLSACGGGSSNGAVAGATPDGPAVVDSFVAFITNLISGPLRDDTLPINIENVQLNPQDDTRPTPVQ
jgi:hypothetical protein